VCLCVEKERERERGEDSKNPCLYLLSSTFCFSLLSVRGTSLFFGYWENYSYSVSALFAAFSKKTHGPQGSVVVEPA